MQAVGILVEEHFWIGKLLDCLQRLAEESRSSGIVGDGGSSELLSLLDSFADHRHQDKEERILFPRLMVRADEQQSRVLEHLLEEHADERRLMMSIRSNLLGALHGEPVCVREFSREAQAYVDLQRRHMASEAATLLPMAERLLTAQDDRDVVSGFGAVDAQGAEARHRVIERAGALCQELLPEGEGA
jgi:hemerythrin-like domain-containing protein